MLRPELTRWHDTDPDRRGSKRNLQVFSGVPEKSLDNWADGMQGHLVSASLNWFNYLMADRVFNDIPEVRKWRQDAAQAVYSIFRDSNFYASLGPVFKDAGSIGDGTLWMDSEDSDTIDFQSFHPREVYHAKDIFHRKFNKHAKDAADLFGKEKLSRALNNDLTNNPFSEYEFIQVCYKKGDKILEGEKGIPNRKFISIYIQAATDKKEPVRVAGYNTKPYARWKFSTSSDTTYGWGLGCSAIVTVFGLNETARTNMVAQQQAVNPAILAHSTMRGRINTNPGGRTYFDQANQGEVKPIMDKLNIPFGLDREDRLAAEIDSRFMGDFFFLLTRSQKPMTATEILEKAGERSILLAPKVDRLETDLLNPIHDRVVSVGRKKNLIPEPPDILMDSDGRIDVEYVGPLAQAQKKLLETRRRQSTFASILPIIEADPTTLDNIDLDKTLVNQLREDEFPEEEIRRPEEVQAIREQRAQQARAQAELETLERGAEQVPNLSKAPEPGSPMEQLAGTT